MNKTNQWTHDGLQSDLAEHLASTRDRIIWEDMQIGPSGSPRPDVYTIPKSYTKFRPLAYEIKISVSDFRRDVTTGKWQSYLEFASGVIFAVPSGLISKADVPTGCGLMARNEDGWRTMKAPTLKHLASLPHQAWLKLLIDGIDRKRGGAKEREFNHFRARQALMKKFGDRVGELVWNLARSEELLQYELQADKARHDAVLEAERKRYLVERERQKSDQAQIDAGRAMLSTALGLCPDANTWAIVQQLQRARSKISEDHEVRRLMEIIHRIRMAVSKVDE